MLFLTIGLAHTAFASRNEGRYIPKANGKYLWDRREQVLVEANPSPPAPKDEGIPQSPKKGIYFSTTPIGRRSRAKRIIVAEIVNNGLNWYHDRDTDTNSWSVSATIYTLYTSSCRRPGEIQIGDFENEYKPLENTRVLVGHGSGTVARNPKTNKILQFSGDDAQTDNVSL